MLNLLHLPVGMSSPVRGRVDASAAKMKATFDINMRILSITCDAKLGWRIDISVPDSGAMEPVFMLNTMNVHPIEHIYKDGAVFPRPGLAEVPHVQHMGTMDVSWAFTSPPSGMAMVGQPGGGPIKHLSGLGAVGGFARAFEPRSSTGAVRGSLSPEGSPVWGPYGGEPLLAGARGRVPSPPT